MSSGSDSGSSSSSSGSSSGPASLEDIQDDIDRLLLSIFSGVTAHVDHENAASDADKDALVTLKAEGVAKAYTAMIGHINSLGGISSSRSEQNALLSALSVEYEQKKASVLLLDQKLTLLSAQVDRSLEEVRLGLMPNRASNAYSPSPPPTTSLPSCSPISCSREKLRV